MSKAKIATRTIDLPSLHIYTMLFWTAIFASVVALAPIVVSEGRGKLAFGLKNLRIPAILINFTRGCTWGRGYILLYRLCKSY